MLNTGAAQFGFAVNDPSTGAASDADSTPSAFLREVGAAASDAPITTGLSVALLSNAGYPPGLYEVTVNGTTAGLVADTEYELYVSATVGGVTTAAMIGVLITSELLDETDLQDIMETAIDTKDLVNNTNFVLRSKLADEYAEQATLENVQLAQTENWQAMLDGTDVIKVNVIEVNGVLMTGAGTSLDKWRAA